MSFIIIKCSSFYFFGIFCKIFLFPCAISGIFLLTAEGKLLTAHAIGTPFLSCPWDTLMKVLVLEDAY